MTYDKRKEIREFIVTGLLTARMAEGDRIQDLRFFTNLFKVNPNIVKDALSHMEEENLIKKADGAYIISAGDDKISQLREEEINRAINQMLEKLEPMGVGLDEVVEVLNMRNVANG